MGLLKTQVCRTESTCQISVRFLEVAIALCRPSLLVHHFEGLCAFRDTAVKQYYRHLLVVFLSTPILWIFALTTRYHNPDEVHKEIIPPEVIRFRATVCQTLDVMIKHACSIVKNVSIYLA